MQPLPSAGGGSGVLPLHSLQCLPVQPHPTQGRRDPRARAVPPTRKTGTSWMPRCSVRSGWSTCRFSSSQARPYTVMLAMTVKAYLGEMAGRGDTEGRAQLQPQQGHLHTWLPANPGPLKPALHHGTAAEVTPPSARRDRPALAVHQPYWCTSQHPQSKQEAAPEGNQAPLGQPARPQPTPSRLAQHPSTPAWGPLALGDRHLPACFQHGRSAAPVT